MSDLISNSHSSEEKSSETSVEREGSPEERRREEEGRERGRSASLRSIRLSADTASESREGDSQYEDFNDGLERGLRKSEEKIFKVSLSSTGWKDRAEEKLAAIVNLVTVPLPSSRLPPLQPHPRRLRERALREREARSFASSSEEGGLVV